MVYRVLTNEEMTTESQRYNFFTRNGGNAIPKHAGPEAKGKNTATGLALLWPVTHSGEISTTGKSHGKNPDRFSFPEQTVITPSSLQGKTFGAGIKFSVKSAKLLM